MEGRTSTGCMCQTGFFCGKTACFDGNAAVRNHCRRQLGMDGDNADGGLWCLRAAGKMQSNGVRDYCP